MNDIATLVNHRDKRLGTPGGKAVSAFDSESRYALDLAAEAAAVNAARARDVERHRQWLADHPEQQESAAKANQSRQRTRQRKQLQSS